MPSLKRRENIQQTDIGQQIMDIKNGKNYLKIKGYSNGKNYLKQFNNSGNAAKKLM